MSSRKWGGGFLAPVHNPRLATAAKRQLYKQMPQSFINNKLHIKKKYLFDRKSLSSHNFKKQPSYTSNERKHELDLERKIARVQAEEQTYANAELETARVKKPSEIPAPSSVGATTIFFNEATPSHGSTGNQALREQIP